MLYRLTRENNSILKRNEKMFINIYELSNNSSDNFTQNVTQFFGPRFILSSEQLSKIYRLCILVLAIVI